jgi:hypothetical protein
MAQRRGVNSGAAHPHLYFPTGLLIPGFSIYSLVASTTSHGGGFLWYEPFLVSRAISIDQAAIEVTTVGTSNLRMGCYATSFAAPFTPTGGPLFDSGDVANNSLGIKTYSLPSPVTLSPGWYASAYMVNDTNMRARVLQGTVRETVVSIGGNVFGLLGSVPFVAQAYGAMPASPPAPTSYGAWAAAGVTRLMAYRLAAA